MIRNFLFHRVGPDKDKLWPPMRTELFEKCIRYISERYQVIRIEDLPGYKSQNTKPLATISFDDGYKDNLVHALPILNKYTIKASFYVVTQCIDTNTPTWTYILDHLFQNTKKRDIKLDFDFLPVSFLRKRFRTKAARTAYAKKLKPFLKTLDHHKRQAVLRQISKQLDDTQLPELMMSWADLRYLNAEGHAIGSHSLTHSMLGTIQDEKLIKEELETSARVINQQIGVFPVTISYPLGSYNQQTVRLSREAGYKIGLAVKQEIYNPENHTIFEVPRIELYNEPWWKTRMRIDHSLEKIKQLIRK